MPISARPDSIGQGRVLRLLRDEGSRSRAELGELAGLTRSRLEAELTRLMQLGLVQEAGKAASRGGRRSTLVELSPFLHFGGVDLGASSMRV
ncbi:MAG TPA: sugar kinase, partial [Propionibacteriaceae bacterium]|nr:sugar kinase [Propionibacteriaceae bacterium]